MYNMIVHHIEGRNIRPAVPEVIDPIVTLAKHLDEILDEGPEKNVALRKLLECCDAAVRCRITDMENRIRDVKVKAVSAAVKNSQMATVTTAVHPQRTPVEI